MAGVPRLLGALLCGSCVRLSSQSSALVGPGAVGSYQGGGGGRRYGGYVRVQDPQVGFFLAGSSIRELNGLYGRVQTVTYSTGRQFQLAYRHDFTGWYLALATATEDDRQWNDKATVWVLIDNDANVRFRHEGDTLIPGSGTRWVHVRQTPGTPGQEKASTELTASASEDEARGMEELPWQVIGVGAENLMQRLRGYMRFYKHTVQQALAGHDLPPLPYVPWGGDSADSPPAGLQVPLALPRDHAAWPCQDDEELTALTAAAFAAAARRDRWPAAMLRVQAAACHRSRRAFREAAEELAAGLALFPRYKEGLLERGLLLLDEDKPAEAILAFETLLRVDRQFPGLDSWLVRAHGLERRRREAAARASQTIEAQATAHCVAWRQTGACDPAGAREPAADRGCNASVEGGLSGFCECQGGLGAAGEVPCLHEAFTCADKCLHKWEALDEAGKQKALAQVAAAGASSGSGGDPCAPSASPGGPPDWCSPSHYQALGIRCDLPVTVEGSENEELKRAYKRRSLQVHPDKRGGSVRAFQRVAEAHEVLLDPERRRAFDEGADFPAERQDDGTEGPSHKAQIEKKYFPERFDFEPFGDPHADRKERQAAERRYLERQRQDALARGERAEL